MREPEEVPRSLIAGLAVLAVLSFTGGSMLELSGDGWLAAHPYWGNLLSGVTGFAASGLVVSVVFRRMQTRQRRQVFLHSIQPELERAAGQLIALAYRILDWTGEELTRRERAAFLTLDDPEEQARAFKIIVSAPRAKPLGLAMPGLVHAAAATADRFKLVEETGRTTVRALNKTRTPPTFDLTLAMQARGSGDAWLWHAADIPRAKRERIVQDLDSVTQAIEATELLDLPPARSIADTLRLARARAEAFRSDPDPRESVDGALVTLSRITIGLPGTAVPAAQVTRLLEHCSNAAFRPLQVCADLVVAWSLLLDLTRHRRLDRDLRAALAEVIPGAGSLRAAPVAAGSPASDLDHLTRGYSAGEWMVRSWYERDYDPAD